MPSDQILSASRLTLGYEPGLPLLRNMDLSLGDGDSLLVCGATGRGKSTLLAALSGIIPHITSVPHMTGEVSLRGRPLSQFQRDDLFASIGFVAQNVEDQLWDLSTEDVIAFPMENRALPKAQIRDRLRALMEELELTRLAGRRVLTLSGGERRMVVMAAALASAPEVLALDEPTTGLDLGARVRLRRTLAGAMRGVRALIVAEQDPTGLAGVAAHLSLIVDGKLTPPRPTLEVLDRNDEWRAAGLLAPRRPRRPRARPAPGSILLTVQGLRTELARKTGEPVINGLDLELRQGDTLAMIGPNGAGKTTLVRSLLGLARASRGTIAIDGQPVQGWSVARRAAHIAYVPQNVRQILFQMTVLEEVVFAIGRGAAATDEIRDKAHRTLRRYEMAHLAEANPFALSARQQALLGLACADAAEAQIAIVDEPLLARDLDARRLFDAFLEQMRDSGRAVILISHDLELVADAATRTIIVDGGALAFDGGVEEAWSSPAFRRLGWDAPYELRWEGAA